MCTPFGEKFENKDLISILMIKRGTSHFSTDLDSGRRPELKSDEKCEVPLLVIEDNLNFGRDRTEIMGTLIGISSRPRFLHSVERGRAKRPTRILFSFAQKAQNHAVRALRCSRQCAERHTGSPAQRRIAADGRASTHVFDV